MFRKGFKGNFSFEHFTALSPVGCVLVAALTIRISPLGRENLVLFKNRPKCRGMQLLRCKNPGVVTKISQNGKHGRCTPKIFALVAGCTPE